MTSGKTFGESVRVVGSAVDMGINYIDTAAVYGTEEIVGAAVRGRRDEVVLSTKAMPFHSDGSLFDRATLRRSVEESLRRLDTDYVDVFHLHGVTTAAYESCVTDLLPELRLLRDRGWLRFIAVSERFAEDPAHGMLQLAARDNCWDVVMVGFNLLNRSARDRVLARTRENDIGVEVMFAVRRALSDPSELRAVVARLVTDGHVDAAAVDMTDPLGFLVHEAGASSVVDAAYRLAAHEPGCHVVLTGTGSVEHLRANVRSIQKPSLPAADLRTLESVFAGLDHVTGN